MGTTSILQLTASSSSSSFSSSSSSLSPLWDVFLSFYGKDTRSSFISHLYFALDQAGIQTFRDDPALEKGQQISSGLLYAIKIAKMCIIVLSENYASSAWCLNELVEILSCNRTKNQAVPVFYYVDPSDLRHQRGSFGEALDFYKKIYSVNKIEKWRSALAEIADLAGYHLKKDADENESDTIQAIVKYVVQAASTRRVLHLEEFLFGIDFVVEDIYQKLSMESNDVRVIGICGIGGIGKTTIAKACYNKFSNEFDMSCFSENVKQISLGSSPLRTFLEHLLGELLRRKDYKVHDVGSGIRHLKQILCSKKALIVLDNLDQSSQSELLVRICNLFCSGSRTIITTRDVNLLNQIRVDISEVDIYMVKELGQKESLELFSYHAFRKTMLPENFIELSKKFVKYAGGLPLALKILGSSLRGRTDVSFWKAQLKKVRVNQEIHKILKLSYDELGEKTEKAIFLDIVFFFIGKDKDEAVHVFKSCDFYPEAGIPILVERCLLTIDKDNKFQMHSLIQDMGKEVIVEESKHGKCRRLYLSQGNTLQNLEGTNTIEGLILDLTMTKTYCSAKIFEKLPNLRLLEIIGAYDIKGNFENSFHELRCIRWSHCPWIRLPFSFRPHKLVSFDMPFNNFKALPKGLKRLKTLNVSYSKNLKATHDFGDLKSVEKLLLRGCIGVLQVHPSIVQLTNLGHLNLGECEFLKELPAPIGQLVKLGHLDLRDCHSLKRLPEPIKQLTNLGNLSMSFCHNLKRLPEQLGDMKGLKKLDVSHTPIEQLPDSIAQLKKLVNLNLCRCEKLKTLPKQFGNMRGLRSFSASYSALEQLPDSFGHLRKLVSLHLSYCTNLTTLPNSIMKLKLLRNLNLRYCLKLERLPEQLGKMQSLERLDTSYTAIEELPDSIGLLTRLRLLNLSRCKKLNYLPNSIGNLTSLANRYVMQRKVVRINLPDTVKNMKLEGLSLTCDIRLSVPMILDLSCLKSLTLNDEGQNFSCTKPCSLTKLFNLQHLILNNCTSLGSSIPEVPLNLEELEVYNHATLEKLSDLSSLKKLKKLYIWRCISLQSLPPFPPHLESLTAKICTSLQDVPDLSMLKELETLSFIQCNNLKLIILKQSSLQVGRHTSFNADLPNREIAEWFSYRSNGCTISFDIPPNLGDNLLGFALWFVYKCKTVGNISYITAVVTNETKGLKKMNDITVSTETVGEVNSRVECLRGNTSEEDVKTSGGKKRTRGEDISMESGDRIKVSFQRSLYCYNGVGMEFQCGEVNVVMCGAHVIQKTPSFLC